MYRHLDTWHNPQMHGLYNAISAKWDCVTPKQINYVMHPEEEQCCFSGAPTPGHTWQSLLIEISIHVARHGIGASRR